MLVVVVVRRVVVPVLGLVRPVVLRLVWHVCQMRRRLLRRRVMPGRHPIEVNMRRLKRRVVPMMEMVVRMELLLVLMMLVLVLVDHQLRDAVTRRVSAMDRLRMWVAAPVSATNIVCAVSVRDSVWARTTRFTVCHPHPRRSSAVAHRKWDRPRQSIVIAPQHRRPLICGQRRERPQDR
jgi:hypothetical protein